MSLRATWCRITVRGAWGDITIALRPACAARDRGLIVLLTTGSVIGVLPTASTSRA